MFDVVTKNLPVGLTAEEFDAKASELTALILEVEEVKREKSAANAEFKGRIDSLSARIQDLTVIVNKRAEVREVDCEERLNPDKKIIEIYRTDTGEMVDTRGITPRDLQRSLEFREVEETSDGDGE